MPKHKQIPAAAEVEPEQAAISGRAVRLGLPVAVVAAGGAYYAGLLPETAAGVVVAALVAVAVAGYLARSLIGPACGWLENGVAVGAIILTLAASAIPVIFSVAPGAALARGELHAVGDRLPLPDGAGGRVRLLLHGALSGSGSANVEFEIDGTEPPIAGGLERNMSQARAGRRGYVTVAHERNTEYLDGAVADGRHDLELSRLRGPLAGGLQVQVFRDRWPLPLEVTVLVLGLLAAAVLDVRLKRRGAPAAAAGIAAFFGLFGSMFVTPDSAVRPEIGALILGVLVGATCGSVLALLGRRIFRVEPAHSR